MSAPLAGLHIVEIAGLGPAPFAGMMLADHGAKVTLVHRADKPPNPKDPLNRGRTHLSLDLKNQDDIQKLKDVLKDADGLIEGFRPGVMERLGLGPEDLAPLNPHLVYGRMTGWGQTGPLAHAAGHDINYIALSGALHTFGRKDEKPTPPINMVGDFGGGGMLLAFGMLAALHQAKETGKGQVIDCAMTDGSALLMSMIWGFKNYAGWQDERGTNLLDTGAHFYDTYKTKDQKFIALGAIEPQFYATFRKLAGLDTDPTFDPQMDRTQWPALKSKLDEIFATKTREEWCDLLEGTDACFAPVLSMSEAPKHPHNQARQTFTQANCATEPAPAPRFSPLKH